MNAICGTKLLLPLQGKKSVIIYFIGRCPILLLYGFQPSKTLTILKKHI